MASSKPKAQTSEAPSNPPLFFEKPATLSLDRHANACLDARIDLGFAKGTNSVPLNLVEFVEAAKHYPIVFTTDETAPIPLVALGWEKENYFVTAKGDWKEGVYIPAYVRQYPFIFFEDKENDRLYLCVDEGCKNFHATKVKDGLAFYEEGKASPMSEHALEYCKAYYQEMQRTRAFSADLVKHGLLSPYHSRATLNGKDVQLSGFQMIDENKVNALSDAAFLELRQKGALAFIYLAMASSTNWKSLAEAAPKK